MKNTLNNLTIVTITFNDKYINRTFKSYKEHIDNGVKLIIVNGGLALKKSVKGIINNNNLTLIEEPDKGRYDGLNKGIERVKTKYFILVHAGDELLIKPSDLSFLLDKMDSEHLDLILGNQYIDFYNKIRKHTVTFWKPWMLGFGAQPPHMPIIYNTFFVKDLIYDYSSNIIADHIYLTSLFNLKPKWIKSDKYHIKMLGGGVTSSGIKSFFIVSNEFRKEYGLLKATLMFFLRVPLKIIQMF